MLIESWTEAFTLAPTCESNYTTWTWTASYCTNNSVVANKLWTEAHTGPLDPIAKAYGNATACSN